MRRLLAAFIIAVSVAASPVAAQWTGTRTGPRPAKIPDNNLSKADLSRATMRSFSKCVIGVSRQRVINYLDTFPSSKEAFELANGLSRDDCLVGADLRFSEKLFRWSAYDELYNAEFNDHDLTTIATIPETDYVAMTKGLNAEQFQFVAIWQLGECTVRAAPKAAQTLVRSQIGSSAEEAAIQEILPFVSGCVNKDNELKFSKAVFRGVMAEALYKLAMKANGAATARGSN
ncbi:MAG: hypothetical protein KA312_00095 [Sphingorhabdus sp.]|nr:hypothetical protein [Sphingorhabdus sp.]